MIVKRRKKNETFFFELYQQSLIKRSVLRYDFLPPDEQCMYASEDSFRIDAQIELKEENKERC